ncbi:hypothetical protein G4Y79_20600 [Phototrophicus methaneseepsis]|uniref:PKD/Chitinase domain-containing protein n=1 Tax=Phototrophicus methaneseepsis TaxID=2710758 RepID=A0A7S8E7Z9_9CHLR|nr:hypothetical protein [Phototrophicus methaneseepsis]QPC82060.1 hypothetical protein G4Y79_20600 [Phototrophicus methaneseepsis]
MIKDILSIIIVVIMCKIISINNIAEAQLDTVPIIKDITYSPDGSFIAIVSAPSFCGIDENNYRITVVEAQSLYPVAIFTGYHCPILDAAWNPNGEKLVGGGSEGISIVWDVNTANQVSISNHVAPGRSDHAWNPEGTLYIGRTGGNAYIFNANTGEIVYTLTGNTSISAIDWGTNNVIAYGDIYGQIRLLNYSTQQEISVVQHHANHIGLVKWNRQATKYASADRDNQVIIWDANGEVIQSFSFETYVTELVWNPDGTQIIIGKIDEGAEIWDVTTGQKLVDVIINQPITALDWSPDGNQIAYAVFPVLENLIEVVEVSTLFPTRPIADAGADITILANPSGTANVLLDASGSTDSDGTILSYQWFESSNLMGTSISQMVTLPIGTHTIQLEVTDDSSQTDTDTIIVTVEEL